MKKNKTRYIFSIHQICTDMPRRVGNKYRPAITEILSASICGIVAFFLCGFQAVFPEALKLAFHWSLGVWVREEETVREKPRAVASSPLLLFKLKKLCLQLLY